MADNDTFTLSLGQAQQLEFALRRNGWAAADVHRLVAKDNLAKVLNFLNHGCQYPVPPGMQLLTDTQVARLEAFERELAPALGAPDYEKLKQYADTPLQEVFTLEMTNRLGFMKAWRTRFLGVMAQGYAPDIAPVSTIGQLAAMSYLELMRTPGVSKKTADIVRQVLATIGLDLGMK